MEGNIITVEARTCETVVSEIKATIASVNQTALLGAITVGKDLMELKELVPHGEWGSYIEEHLHFSERKAQQFMQIADRYGDENSEFYKAISKPHICADLSFSNALRLLALPETEVGTFVEEHDVANMKVAELEEEIRRLKEHTIGAVDESAYKELSELRAERESLRAKIEELEAATYEGEAAEKRAKEREAEMKVLTEALEKKKAEESKLKEKLKAAEEASQIAAAKAKAEAAEEARKEADKAVQERLSDMQKEIDKAIDRASKAEKKLQSMNNEDFAIFKVKMTILQETFNDILNAIENIKIGDPEQAAKLSGAFKTVMIALQKRLGSEADYE